jgi:hypothetical protein
VRFTEIDLFGVYVAPMSLMMVAAWLVTIALRRVSARFGLLRYGESASPISILTKASGLPVPPQKPQTPVRRARHSQ